MCPEPNQASVVGSVDTGPQQAVGTAVVPGNPLRPAGAADLLPVADAAAGRDLGRYWPGPAVSSPAPSGILVETAEAADHRRPSELGRLYSPDRPVQVVGHQPSPADSSPA